MFNKIPGCPFAFSSDENLIMAFTENKKLNTISDIKQGLITGDTKKFLRYWFEINIQKFYSNIKNNDDVLINKYKWFPYNKGGNYRKWYGNHEYVINWENNGEQIKNFKNEKGKLKSRPQNLQYSFKKSISWSAITSSEISFRYYPNGFLFDVSGSSIFINDAYLFPVLGLLNSKICQELLNIISPTINYSAGYISLLPINLKNEEIIEKIVIENINICKKDWDEHEISWNYTKNPLLTYKKTTIKSNFEEYKLSKENLFKKLKNNEIKLNKIFSELYNLNINQNIENKHVSIKLVEYESTIKKFLSYSVGCMLGRYSLDNEGLQFAGGDFNINNYHKFIPDDDNIIPVLDTAYFDDDIVGYFTKFVETCFGSETLEENLDFIAGALSKSNKPSREIIRNYLLKNFFNDHKTTYKKCPIYWQFSSGKQNAFNCLIYMHRYEPSLVARIRTDYLHKTQKAIEQRIANNDSIINNSTNKTEIAKATKEKAKLQKQLKETQDYDEVLAHVANQNIEIDLDDGVKVNYAKFQNIEIKKEGSKTKKVNLLKKI